jgi:hypothetical protein
MVWKTIWRNFAETQGPNELRVKLFATGPMWENMNTDKANALLKPVIQVTSPKDFELSLSFPCMYDSA